MSIEALWTIKFEGTPAVVTGNRGGGVVVLETQRVLGGDSGTYYVGTYSLVNGQFKFKVHVGVHDASVGSVFGAAVSRCVGPNVPVVQEPSCPTIVCGR